MEFGGKTATDWAVFKRLMFGGCASWSHALCVEKETEVMIPNFLLGESRRGWVHYASGAIAGNAPNQKQKSFFPPLKGRPYSYIHRGRAKEVDLTMRDRPSM